MKKRNLWMGLFVGLALSACSNEDVVNTPEIFKGDEAYMAIRLSDVNSNSRGTSDAENPFRYGMDEQTVKIAHFYFYDAAGNYVTEGRAWNGGDSNGPSVEGTSDDNIEFKANTLVVLKGLTKKNYPKYMITVLNPQTDFTPANTLAGMQEKLSLETGEGIHYTEGDTKYFTMSTTSYFPAGVTAEHKYYVTELQEKNFYTEPIPSSIPQDNIVEVYVERLAVKVELDVASLSNKEEIGNETYYKLTATVAGEANAGTELAKTDLYVKVLSWGLNATAKKSNIVKEIDFTWKDDATTKETLSTNLGFDWNDEGNYRSYWGKSWNYGVTTYPTSGYELNKTNENDYPLNYVSWNQLAKVTGEGDNTVAYCPENTNTSAIVSANFPSAVTSVLVKAQIYQIVKDDAGNVVYEEDSTTLKMAKYDLVRYNGMLYMESHLLATVLNQTNPALYRKTSADGVTPAVYEQIGVEDLELKNEGDGKITVKVKDDSLGKYLYADKNGVLLSESSTTSQNAEVAKITGFIGTSEAIAYKEGMMYYNIPIEHLNHKPGITVDNEFVNFTDTEGKRIYAEAEYGVVRNHWYKINITDLDQLGMGVFDPDEYIVPNPDTDKYYVGANINILSWKIVNQGADL